MIITSLKKGKKELKAIRTINILLILLIIIIKISLAMPQGTGITYNSTETAPIQTAGSLTTAGGTFTTLVLNTTTQTPRWKAYVGNVSGKFVLADSDNNNIYDWNSASFTGEVYATRNPNPNWDSINCASNTLISNEENTLNFTGTEPDSIFNTFNKTTHKDFYVGSTYISASSCRAIATYVNSQAQAESENADFQEVLLEDGNNLIFTALIENSIIGFDGSTYDFQMIVPESEIGNPHTYYFFTELS